MSQHESKTSTFTTTDGVRLHCVDQGEAPVFLMRDRLSYSRSPAGILIDTTCSRERSPVPVS